MPLTEALLFTVKVFDEVPPDKVNPLATAVGVRPLIVLFVKASVPAKVAIVPVVGKVTSVSPILVNVVLKLPAVVKLLAVHILPPKVIVL